MAEKILQTVLLLALPASGKSEVRRYLEFLSPERRAAELHLGEDVQLDDFPYVHLMRRIDNVLASQGFSRLFFKADDRPFLDPRDWGTLINLLNDDYAAILAPLEPTPPSAAAVICHRIDAAALPVGIPARIEGLDPTIREMLLCAIEDECQEVLGHRQARHTGGLLGKTLIIEFARGGPQGSTMPLPAPFGYRYSLSLLSEAILRHAVVLYVWVTPEESRRKNRERTDPDNPGSILHHGVPTEVMLQDYGCDDIEWLEQNAQRPGTVTVDAGGRVFHLPIACLDNRSDMTSFLRQDPGTWKQEDIERVHQGLRQALDLLASRHESGA
ncbi:hypothetical protein JXA88_08645 [Candidatus Fermentibacteria bacterium]|nr:hypothetical protein [Candidatus Fermentibacteria bacterium]